MVQDRVAELKAVDPSKVGGLLKRRQEIMDWWQDIFPFLFKHFPSSFSVKTHSQGRWAWAVSVCVSRLFALNPLESGDPDPIRSLVPFVDMANHQVHSHAYLGVSAHSHMVSRCQRIWLSIASVLGS